MTDLADRQGLLRWSLRGNAVFSILSGLLFALASAGVANFIGLADPRILLGVGLNLLGFAALLGFLSTRETIHLPTAMLVVWLDLAWVLGTIPVAMAGVLNRSGVIAALAVADVVLVFAVLQYVGVRRARSRERTGTLATAR